MEEMNKSSQSPPPTSFFSLPNDVILNCLSRISRIHYPTLSLVSKGFQSFIASPELEATRSCIGEREDYLCVSLKLKNNKPNPCWFAVSSIPKQKLKPLPSFPHQYPESSAVVSIGSEIYMIGGFFKGKRSRRVWILDCRSHHWCRLPNMHLPRASAFANVIEGKIYVTGGCRSKNIENSGEVYDLKTKTWTTKLDPQLHELIESYKINYKINSHLSLVRHKIESLKLFLMSNSCYITKIVALFPIIKWRLYWRDQKEGSGWVSVKGLEELSSNHHFSVANSGKGRVTVWKKSVTTFFDPEHCTEKCETHIWCADISFERRGLTELWGLVDQFRKVFTVDGNDSTPDFFLNSAIVTY